MWQIVANLSTASDFNIFNINLYHNYGTMSPRYYDIGRTAPHAASTRHTIQNSFLDGYGKPSWSQWRSIPFVMEGEGQRLK